ncbi:MAG: hypothetical protein MJ252_18760 [archaeon]|nr:hypothetical protein [archaeon]
MEKTKEEVKEEVKETEVREEKPMKQRPKDVFIQRRVPKGEGSLKLISNLLEIKFNYGPKQLKQFSFEADPEISDNNFELKTIVFNKIKKDLESEYGHAYRAGNTFFATFSTDKEEKKKQEEKVFETSVNGVDYKIKVKPTAYKIDLSNVNDTTDGNIKIRSLINHIIKSLFQANDKLKRFENGGYFDISRFERLENRRAMSIPGFTTACTITQGGLALRITDDRKYISGVSCYEIYKKIKDQYGIESKELKDRFRHRSIITKYGDQKVYLIEGIQTEMTPRNTNISVAKEKNIIEESLFDYYKNEYDIEIKDKDQPLLLFKPNKKINKYFYFVPELCDMCGIDDTVDNSSDANDMKKRLAAKGRLKAHEKLNILKKVKNDVLLNQRAPDPRRQRRNAESFRLLFNGENNIEEGPQERPQEKPKEPSAKEIAESWDLDFGEFMEIKGRSLNEPEIRFSDGRAEFKNARFRAKKCIEPVDLRRQDWICISACEDYKSSMNDAKVMLGNLNKACRNLGIYIEEPEIIALNRTTTKDQLLEQIRKINMENKKLIFFILSRFNKKFYGDIKRMLCCEMGIPSQMVCNMNRSQNLSYYSNVLNQINVKCGGSLYGIEFPKNIKDSSIFVGIDSSKAPHGKYKFVITSSYDKYNSKYYTRTIICNPTKDEKQSALREGIVFALSCYSEKNNNKLPKRAIIYRNGGNDKQKLALFRDEIPIFKEVFGTEDKSTFEPDWKCQFCYVVVNKRTEMRFFEKNQDNRIANPPNGTVVDTKAVNPDYFEFYMQPQFVNQGVARPVHFHCIYDTTEIPAVALEEITYKQTYYYWNWNGPIKVPACLKYAEKENEFYGKVLGGLDPNAGILDTPFYI